MSGPIRLGLLGCGRAAERLHVPAIGPATATQLTGVFDPVRSRGEQIASRQSGCRVFESAESLVGSGEVDAVIVASPAESHAAMASLALLAGLPVLIEKPVAGSLDEGTRLEAVQQETGVAVMVGLNRRWWAPAINLRQRLDRPPRVPAVVKMELVSDVGGWSALSATSDPLDDLGTHQLDLLRFLFSCEIETVRATRPAPEEFHLSVRLLDGTQATCIAAYRNRSQEMIQVSIGSERSRLLVGSERIQPASGGLRKALDIGDTVYRRMRRRRGGLSRSYAAQLTSFAACVRDRTPASPCLHDGMAALRAIGAARASLVSGGADVPITSTREP
ncbi:MAG: Gfo/Idh/MocA family oxidoreductase [Gemmatimonadales bacterium]